MSRPTVGKLSATRGRSERDVSNLSEIKFLTVAEVAAVMRVSRMLTNLPRND